MAQKSFNTSIMISKIQEWISFKEKSRSVITSLLYQKGMVRVCEVNYITNADPVILEWVV